MSNSKEYLNYNQVSNDTKSGYEIQQKKIEPTTQKQRCINCKHAYIRTMVCGTDEFNHGMYCGINNRRKRSNERCGKFERGQ